ncbi:hypothetical protein L1D14_03790 [Vibrio tubiashii]|uniref:hypothetical protein n=1 Tax=Vibrio tubiashii TaxID=29498 RepID=UPI001EFE0880|nr:hypothetical protein [Vibrio tubiashii]MCG9575352.1 hypothetical protein [Vibrio tubiashii]
MTYTQQFDDAISRTKHMGFETPESGLNGKPLNEHTRTQVYSIIQELLSQFSPQDVSQKCFWATLMLKQELEQRLEDRFTFTLGYITLEGKQVFHTDIETLCSYMDGKNQPQSSAVNLHAWLTTSGGEIIDVTLMTTLSVVRKQPDLMGGVIASFNESLRDLSYHPQLTGDEYLKACGFLVDFEFWEVS